MIIWFKNLRAYRFTRAMELPVEALEQQMADFAFTPCASQDIAKFGWASAIGGDAFLPVVPLSVQKPIELTLTEWVRSGDAPAGFSLLEAAELKSVLEDGGVIRCKQQALTCEEITAHIDAQKLVTNLALDWQDRITFILHQDGSIKRLKFADELREQNYDIDHEDVAARIDADYALMTAELGAMVKQLTDALGGVAEVSA